MLPETSENNRINDANQKKQRAQKKAPTQKQINTSKLVHELLSYYDELQRMYNANSSEKINAELQAYASRIRSQYQLALLTQETINKRPNINTLTHISKIRELIKSEVDQRRIVKIDGILRNPKTTPYYNMSASGNIITILITPMYIDSLVDVFVKALADFPVRISVPCNNMIMIIEIGEVTEKINPDLHKLVRQKLITFSLHNDLESYPVVETTKYYIK